MAGVAQRTRARSAVHVKDIVRKYGRCLALIGMDPHFHDISVGLFIKGRVMTVWSYSNHEGTAGRLSQVRDRMVALGGFEPIRGNPIQALYPNDQILERPLRFLFSEAVEKAPDTPVPSGPISTKDTKSRLTFTVTPSRSGDGKWTYRVTAEGEADNAEQRIRAVVGGFMRYGECVRIAPDAFAFPDGERHDGLARVLLPYARNVTGVEQMLEAEELHGQMTVQTLGFSKQ